MQLNLPEGADELGLSCVWYLARLFGIFGSLSGIKMIVIPDNACVNSSMFCAIETGTAESGILERATCEPLVAAIGNTCTNYLTNGNERYFGKSR